MNAVRTPRVKKIGDEISYRVNQARLAWIDSLLSELGEEPAEAKCSEWAQVSWKYSMDPLFWIPILLLVLFLAYEFVGVFGAGFLVDVLEEGVFGKWVLPAATSTVGRAIPWGVIRG